ncbi:Hypothetical protein CINCED_3A000404 [Cinara cedri]|uniref:Uncharacterized protein n=1 Tax=Cinara cedri TaxID=506608 RepID=A0A5E4NSE2_9HEMI|nr:Hypothetical protein CINCED_3A000404 [Cinara cedri]
MIGGEKKQGQPLDDVEQKVKDIRLSVDDFPPIFDCDSNFGSLFSLFQKQDAILKFLKTDFDFDDDDMAVMSVKYGDTEVLNGFVLGKNSEIFEDSKVDFDNDNKMGVMSDECDDTGDTKQTDSKIFEDSEVDFDDDKMAVMSDECGDTGVIEQTVTAGSSIENQMALLIDTGVFDLETEIFEDSDIDFDDDMAVMSDECGDTGDIEQTDAPIPCAQLTTVTADTPIENQIALVIDKDKCSKSRFLEKNLFQRIDRLVELQIKSVKQQNEAMKRNSALKERKLLLELELLEKQINNS